MRRARLMCLVACLLAVCLKSFPGETGKADAYGPGPGRASIRFFNGLVCTMEDGAVAAKRELWVRDGRVVPVDEDGTADAPFDLEIDLDGDLIIPGLKNAHAHSPMTFLRSYAEDLPLDRWLTEKVFPMEAQLTSEDVYHLYKLAILEYLSGGITAAFDMYLLDESMPRAAVETGFRAAFCYPLHDFYGSLEEQEKYFLRFNGMSGLVKYHLGFHAEYTTSPDLLRGVAALAAKYRSPVFFHNSETAGEVAGCVGRYGKTPTEYLDGLGVLDQGGAAFHCVHMTDRDLDIMKARGYRVVTNPGSNCKLASGIAPVTKMLERGIPVALGTDGPASNNALDMFREMYLASMLQKVSLSDPAALGAQRVLEMAAVEGARAMEFDDCDSLAPGKRADLVVIDMKQPNMRPINNLIANLVYAGGKHNVRLTMIDGRILYEDGRYHIGVEPDELYAEAARIVERMKKD